MRGMATRPKVTRSC